jgi:polysaccharide export outer membrane protein
MKPLIAMILSMNNALQTSMRLFLLNLGWMALLLATGCQTTRPPDAAVPGAQAPASEMLFLREGDTVKIAFPGAPNLDTAQQIRRDGKITLQLVGEVQAAGLKPTDLEKRIIELYASQLLSKEVSVSVQSANFPVFVTGQVLRPGKVIVDRPMTALEAIMEAGGFNYEWADLGAVAVIRQEGDRLKRFPLNMKKTMDGKSSESFHLKPSDIIYVPEKKIF